MSYKFDIRGLGALKFSYRDYLLILTLKTFEGLYYKVNFLSFVALS